MADRAKIRDLSALAPIVGAFLLLSPFLLVFQSARLVFGIPLFALYIFGVWLILIIAAAILSRYQNDDEAGAEAGVEPGAGAAEKPPGEAG